MRTVWILNHYAQVPGGPGGTRHYYLAKYLQDLGWKPYVIAASTELGSGEQRKRDGSQAVEMQEGGIPFVWIQAPKYSGNGIGRIINMISFAAKAWRLKTSKSLPVPDVVIGSSVHPFTGLAAKRIARRFGVPFVFEVRDLWPETLISFGRISRNGLLAKSLRLLESHLYKHSSAIISVLPKGVEYISTCGVSPDKVIWISNGVDASRFDVKPVVDHSTPFTFMYLGAHGRANDLVTVIDAVSLIVQKESSRDFCLRMIGSGTEKAKLSELASSRQLKQIRFESAIPAKNVPSVSLEADAFLILSQNLPDLYQFGVSANKMYDYMAATRPMIAALESPVNPIEQSMCGIVVPPGQPDVLADAMVKLMDMPIEKRREMGLAGRRHVEAHYDYRVLASRLAGLLDSLVE